MYEWYMYIVHRVRGVFRGGGQRRHVPPPRILKEGKKKGRKREKVERKG